MFTKSVIDSVSRCVNKKASIRWQDSAPPISGCLSIITGSFVTNIIAHLHGLSMDLTVGRTIGPTADSTVGWTVGLAVKLCKHWFDSRSNYLSNCGNHWQPCSELGAPNTMWHGPRPTLDQWHLDPSSRLATIDMGRKLGRGSAPFFWEGEAGFPSNTKSPGKRPTSIPSGILIHPAIWPQWIWSENWGCAPIGGEGDGSPSKTVWPGPRPITCVPSFIFIHPTVLATI